MARIKTGSVRVRRHRKILKQARGYNMGRRRLYRRANEAVTMARKHAYIGRRLRKRDFRRLWIQRINAAARLHGLPYSRFMYGLKQSGSELNRKMLADIAVRDADGFAAIVEQAKQGLESAEQAAEMTAETAAA